MKKPLPLFLLLLLGVILITGITRRISFRKINLNNTKTDVSASVPEKSGEITSIDCGIDSCQEMTIEGDKKYALPNGKASPFSGYADPSIRKDPGSGVLWLAYSWPHYKFSGSKQVPSVEIHLAKSVDSGNTWSFVKKLWEPIPINNPANTSQLGYLDYETANLLPIYEKGVTMWFAVTLNYFIPKSGGFAARPSDSFHIRVYKSQSPEGLTSAPFAILGSETTATEWKTNQTLVPRDMDLLQSKSFFWNEPALYYENDALYLTMVAFNLKNRSDLSRDAVYVFSTRPTGSPESWTWSYRGKLAGAEEANQLGAERLTQVDIARGSNEELLLITSPDDWNANLQDYNHKGCVAIEIASLLQPALKKDKNGDLLVRAVVKDSMANELGSAACSYDPASRTGIIFTKRNKTAKDLTTSLLQT